MIGKKKKDNFKQDSVTVIKNPKTKTLVYLALTIAAVLVVLPLMWLFFTSFKSRVDLSLIHI